MKIKLVLFGLGLVLSVGKLMGHSEVVRSLDNEKVELVDMSVSNLCAVLTPEYFLDAIDRGDLGFIDLALHCDVKLVNITDSAGIPALHKAAKSGNLAIVKLMIDKDSYLEIEDDDGWVALILAVGRDLYAMAEYLLNRGADPDHIDRYGKTALHWAATWASPSMIRLLAKHIPVNVRDEEGGTALHDAARGNKVDNVTMLINEKAEVNALNDMKQTPLHIAAKLGRLETVKVLVEKGAVINAVDQFGQTPLLLAVSKKQEEVVRYLLKHHADVNIKDAHGETALSVASANGYANLVSILNEHRVNCMKHDDKKSVGHANGYRNLVADDEDWEPDATIN